MRFVKLTILAALCGVMTACATTGAETGTAPAAAAAVAETPKPAATSGQAAKPAEVDARTEAYLRSESYGKLIEAKFVALQSDLAFPCNKVTTTGGDVIIIDPLAFGAPEHPVSGRWFQRIFFDRCGTPQAQTFEVANAGGEPPKVLGMIAGFTGTDPVMQVDILGKGVLPLGAQLYEGQCEKTKANSATLKSGQTIIVPRVIDSYPAPSPAQTDKGIQVEREVWVIEACRKVTPLVVQMSIDPSKSPPRTFQVGRPAGIAAMPKALLEHYPNLREAWEKAPAAAAPLVEFKTFGKASAKSS